jgi:hypothetical protein
MNRSLLSMVLVVALAGCGAEIETSQVEYGSQQQEGKSSGGTTTTTTTTSGGGKGGKTATTTTTTTVAASYALQTTDARFEGIAPTWKSDFAIYSTYEVMFATEITGSLSGHHTQTVFVSMPGGGAYQRFDVSFATDVAAGLDEQQAEKTETGWRVWISMPVAGTMIEQYSLTGPWTAEVYVDGAAKANVTFNLM